MNANQPIAALFDFDGVVMDTESQYTLFWDAVGKKYHPEIPNFGHHIKGQTLTRLYEKYFADLPEVRERLTLEHHKFEDQMNFEYIPGVVDFMKELRTYGVKIAIVTSSDNRKMANVHRAHPELAGLVDRILTAELFTCSKPHPECFLLGAEMLGVPIENCIVFEDSFHGLEAGNRAGMKVIGLATTNPASAIEDKADLVIPDFVDFNYEKMMAVLE